MKTGYFTFGQEHVHSHNGNLLDKNCVLKIEAEDPRNVMFETFGRKWAGHYDEMPDMRFFPRGVFEF